MKHQKKNFITLTLSVELLYCYENGKKELSTSLFRRMQIKTKENKDV